MKNKLIYILIFVLICSCILGSIIIPRNLLLNKYFNNQNNINTVPSEYYDASSTALSKHLSKLLTSADKISFISGLWDNSYEVVNIDKSILSETQAVNLAKEQLQLLNNLEIYPLTLNSEYDNWYSWTSTLYEYSENTFNTYTCYLWDIIFTKYDNSITQEILMTEDGVILQASISFLDAESENVSEEILLHNFSEYITSNTLKKILHTETVELLNIQSNYINSNEKALPNIYPNTTEQEILKQTSYNIATSLTSSNYMDYIIYHSVTKNQFVYTLIPSQAISAHIETSEALDN